MGPIRERVTSAAIGTLILAVALTGCATAPAPDPTTAVAAELDRISPRLAERITVAEVAQVCESVEQDESVQAASTELRKSMGSRGESLSDEQFAQAVEAIQRVYCE